MAIQNTMMDAIQKHRDGVQRIEQEKSQLMTKHQHELQALQLKHAQEIKVLAQKHAADPDVNNEHVQAFRKRMQGYQQMGQQGAAGLQTPMPAGPQA